MRGAIYARVSTDEQGEKGYSLPTQAKLCKKWCQEHDVDVIHEFFDDYTGQTLDRPGLNELVTYLPDIDIIVCSAPDRLSRNLTQRTILREELIRARVDIAYVSRGIVKNDPGGIFIDNIDGAVAEYEVSMIRERTMRGRIAKAHAGKLVGMGEPPFGYQRQGFGNTVEFVINEYESNIVYDIFEMFVNGTSIQEIADLLTENNVMSRGDLVKRNKKHAGWSRNMVYTILVNESYTGRHQNLRNKIVDGKSVKRPEEELPPIVQIPQIISDEWWSITQHFLSKNKALGARKRQRYPYLLSGCIKCQCGYSMNGQSSTSKIAKAYYVYRCASRNSHDGPCGAKQHMAHRLDSLVWDWISEVIISPEKTEEMLSGAREEWESLNKTSLNRIDSIDIMINKLRKNIEQLIDMRLEGFPADVIEERLQRSKREIIDLERERNTLADNVNVSGYDITTAIKLSEELSCKIDNLTFEEQREIVNLFGVVVIVRSDCIEVRSIIGNVVLSVL